MTVSQFLSTLASPAPTPGGGTASAIAGAMGTSLLTMVAGMPKSKTRGDEDRAALVAAHAALAPLADRLCVLANDDSAAYDEVTAAYRLPKGTDAEKSARAEAVQRALVRATEVPLDTLKACAQALQHASVVERHGNPNAASDVAVAVGLLRAAADGAAANVRVNLDGIKDADLRARLATVAERSVGRIYRSRDVVIG
jgi:formiminotetrahydrofolate cyclodeaminase